MPVEPHISWIASLALIPLLGWSLWSLRAGALRERKLQCSLQAAEQSHGEFFDKAGDGFLVHDASTGAVLEVNETYLQIANCSREQVLAGGVAAISARSVDEIPRVQADVLALVRRAYATGRADFDWPHRRNDGVDLMLSVTLTRAEIRGVGRVLATVRDITRRHQAEAALLTTEARWRAFADASREGVLFYRFGLVTDVNERLGELLGWAPNELVGRDLIGTLVAPAGRETARECLERNHGGGIDLPLQKRTGEVIDCEVFSREARGDVVGQRILCVRDLASKLAIKEALRAQVALVDVTLEATGDGVVGVNLNNEITTINGRFVRMWGVPQDILDTGRVDALLKYTLRLVENPEVCLANLDSFSADPLAQSYHVIHLLDGRFLECRSLPQLVDGRVVGRIWSFHDVTELTSVQRELRELNAELERRVRERTLDLERTNRTLTESNAALEAFSHSVSHDLRTPLRGIDGMSLALSEEYSDKLDDTGRDYLRRVRLGVQRMGRIMDDITHLSRVNRMTVRYENVNLSNLAKDVVEGLRAGCPGREVEFICAEDAVGCGDRRLLHILLENLIGNAWKYSSRQSHAVIEFGFNDVDESTREFFVKDNGVGFDPAYRDKLFTSFMRLHSPSDFEGSGLGLAIVARIVRRLGGTVRGEGQPGAGATFTFTLHPDCDTGEYV